MSATDIKTTKAQFADFIAKGQLWLPYEKQSGAVVQLTDLEIFTPDEIDWKRASGTGKLASFVTFHREYHPDFPPPYNVSIIRLDEGPFVLSTLVDLSGSHKIGMAVAAHFDASGRLVFAPVANT
ncbi:MAG: OB-fold domain-containing protein [Marinosulfonomonas sp.]|nr:OB-fold domain-containing protein [Marinosulfonomonas sp.]